MFDEYPDVLTVAQMAEALGIGRNSAYTLLRTGVIRYFRVGRKLLIPKICLVDYVESVRYNQS